MSHIADDSSPGGWRRSRGWHSELPWLDGTFEVVLPVGDTEEEGPEGMDSHLQDLPLNRFRLAEQVSLARV